MKPSFTDPRFASPPDEEWRAVIGWEDVYEVSSWGRVRRSAAGPHTYPGRMLKLQVNKKGYLIIQLCRPGEKRTLNVSVMISAAFLGRKDGLAVDHIDGNRQNNFLSNLRLVSHSDNAKNRKKNANNSTGVKGVSFRKRNGCPGVYVARIQSDGRRIEIGGFRDLEAARSAYDNAARKLHGAFMRRDANAS